MALPRISRASPVICSQPIGLRLCGIADEPFCPLANGSSTSPISVFCRPRISSANFSSDAAVIASAVISSACRSRWMTCDETGAGSRPSRSQTRASIAGSRCANVPTAPEILPTDTMSRARSTRSRSRCSSAYHSASFTPNVIGSACTPCVRPIIGVRRCSSARSRTASIRPAMPLTIRSQACAHLHRLRGIDDVGRGQAEVQPARRRPDLLGDGRRERDDVVLRGLLDLLDAGDVERGPGAQLARGVGRHEARFRHRVGGRQLDFEPGLVAALIAPDRAHLGVGVSLESSQVAATSPLQSSVRRRSGPEHRRRQRAVREQIAARRAARRRAVTRSTPASVSSRPKWRSK